MAQSWLVTKMTQSHFITEMAQNRFTTELAQHRLITEMAQNRLSTKVNDQQIGCVLPSKATDSCFAVSWEEYAHQCMSWCHWAPALLGSDIQLHEGSGYTGDCSRHWHADSCPCLRMSSYTVSMYLQHIWWKFRSLYLALNGQLLHNTQSHMQVASEWNSVNQNACIQCQTQLPPTPLKSSTVINNVQQCIL